MTGFCSANLSHQPQKPIQQPARNIFAGGLNQNQHARRHERQGDIQFFSKLVGAPRREDATVWRIDSWEAPAPLIVEESRREFLTTIKPQMKEDRCLAIGLNKGFRKTGTLGNQQERPSFLDVHSNQQQSSQYSSMAQSGGPCPHFLAEA